jgi:hypothetical protein
MGIWANLHAGGCLLMLGVLTAIPIAAIIKRERETWRTAWRFWGLCALICVMQPNFVTGNWHALTLVQTTGAEIGEWKPPIAYLLEPNQGIGRIIAGLAPYMTALVLLGLALSRRLRGQDLSTIGAAIALTGLSLVYVRFVHFAAPAWLIILGWQLPGFRAGVTRTIRRITGIVTTCVVLALIWQTKVHNVYGSTGNAVTAAQTNIHRARFPVEAADYLKRIGFKGTIFCMARYGGYLLWRLHPGIQTLLDGRSNVDVHTSKDVHFVHNHHGRLPDSHKKAHAVRRQIASIYERYALDAMVLETPARVPVSQGCHRWIPVRKTPRLEVFLRYDKANAQNLRKAGMEFDLTKACKAPVTPKY